MEPVLDGVSSSWRVSVTDEEMVSRPQKGEGWRTSGSNQCQRLHQRVGSCVVGAVSTAVE
jgi:hypothetical protein